MGGGGELLCLLLWEPLKYTKKSMEEDLLSTQKRAFKKRLDITKKSIDNKDL
jgi:hypothetical protein